MTLQRDQIQCRSAQIHICCKRAHWRAGALSNIHVSERECTRMQVHTHVHIHTHSTSRGRMAQFLLSGKKPPSSQSIKKDKDKKDPNSYRPTSLLRCLAKLLERVINRTLLSFFEGQKLRSPTQTIYRKHRSTENQLALIAQVIENVFQEKKRLFLFSLT